MICLLSDTGVPGETGIGVYTAKRTENTSLNTLRLPTEATDAILDARDRRGREVGNDNNRADERHPFRTKSGLTVIVSYHDGTTARYTVTPRNISCTGVGFLHGNFLHNDTDCVVSLPTLEGDPIDVAGTVVRCQHVQGTVHEVGVLFRQTVDPRQLVPFEGEQPEADARQGLPRLTGRVLCIDNSIEDRDLIRYLLGKLDVNVVMTDGASNAAALVRTDTELDLMLIAHQPPELDAIEVTRALRDKGCLLPVVLLTSDENGLFRTEGIGSVCNEALVKPFDFHALTSVLLQHLPLGEASAENTATAALPSSLWGDEPMRPLILSYLERLTQQVEQLHGVLNDASQCAALCLRIKGSAGGYGYPQISHAAQHLLGLVKADGSLEKLEKQCQVLARLAQRADHVRREAGTSV